MRAILQRIRHARVAVDDEVILEVDAGLLVYVGIAKGDGANEAKWLSNKIAKMRLFPDERGLFDRSLLDTGGTAVVISQFTLLADTNHGQRPSFFNAEAPEIAEPLVERVVDELRNQAVPVKSGSFGSKMLVSSENDGPVTIHLDSNT